jgi:hypothetical protein
MGTAHHLHVVHPRGVPPGTVVPLLLGAGVVVPVEPQPVGSLTAVSPPSFESPKQTRQAAKTSSARCGEKGCIFPASGGEGGKCVHHYREEREPSMYHSKQPTWAAIEQGRFVEQPEELIFGSRGDDRRRFDAERQAFLES